MPLVSVITPVYNSERFIEETVRSILNQTFKDFEYIIVNDHSIDNTLEKIKTFNDKRIKIFSNEGKGSVDSYNKALKESSGKYIAVIDHDDITEPERFEKQVEFLESNRADVTGTFYKVIDENGKLISRQTLPITDPEIKNMMMFRNSMIHTSSMYKKVLIEKFGNYRQDRFPAHDFDFWIRIINDVKFYNIPEFLQSWRVVQSSPSQLNFKLQQSRALEILEDHFNKSKTEPSEKYFMTGRARYYFKSPVSSSKYFLRSFMKGNFSFTNFLFLIKSSLFFPLINIYRRWNSKKYFGKKYA